jgi:hypothetical protein
MFLGLCLEVGEVTCVPLPLVMLVREFPFPSTCVFPLRVSALFPVAADPKDPLPSYVGVPAPTQPKSGKGHAMQGPFLLPVLSEGEMDSIKSSAKDLSLAKFEITIGHNYL